jgi:3-phenylpropionate/trans-cinnamate dioxygenase ferredoxin component
VTPGEGTVAGALVRVGSRQEIGDGEMQYVEAGGKELVVVRVGEELFCIDAVCTHAFGYLDQGELEGFEVQCPLHEGRFDVRSGAAVCLPAVDPVGTYPVVVEDDDVYVRLPG